MGRWRSGREVIVMGVVVVVGKCRAIRCLGV